MKKVMITICLLIVSMCGCTTNVWYQPEKNLRQATIDCRDCIKEAEKFVGFLGRYGAADVLRGCMKEKGYDYIDIKHLNVQHKKVDRWRIETTVAGKR